MRLGLILLTGALWACAQAPPAKPEATSARFNRGAAAYDLFAAEAAGDWVQAETVFAPGPAGPPVELTLVVTHAGAGEEYLGVVLATTREGKSVRCLAWYADEAAPGTVSRPLSVHCSPSLDPQGMPAGASQSFMLYRDDSDQQVLIVIDGVSPSPTGYKRKAAS